MLPSLESKLIEVRDEGTHIPALATRIVATNNDADYPLRRAGYAVGQPYVLLCRLNDNLCHYSPYAWGNIRTMRTIHEYLERYWADVTSGQVVDVRAILGETNEPAITDRLSPITDPELVAR